MVIEDDKPVADQATGSSPSISDRGGSDRQSETRDSGASPDPKNLRSLVKGAIAEQKQVEAKRDPSPARQAAAAQRAREEQTGKFAPSTTDSQPKAGAPDVRSPAAATSSPTAKPDGTAAPATPQASAAVAPPAALSKDVKAIWDTLPAPVQAEFAKREADTAKGVEQLRARYQPIEEALAPIRPLLQQRGLSDGAAVKQLFDWHAALSVPDKAKALANLVTLARSHNIDLSTLAPRSDGASQGSQPNPPQQAIDLAQHLDPILQKVGALETHFERQTRERINTEISSFSKDKPHFDKVRVRMGQLMAAGAASSLDDAYQQATWSDPSIRTEILQAEQAKRESDAQAATAEQQRKAAEADAERKRLEAEQVAKARKAGVGPRAGSPSGSMQVAKAGGKSVRESIAEAVKDRRAAI